MQTAVNRIKQTKHKNRLFNYLLMAMLFVSSGMALVALNQPQTTYANDMEYRYVTVTDDDVDENGPVCPSNIYGREGSDSVLAIVGTSPQGATRYWCLDRENNFVFLNRDGSSIRVSSEEGQAPDFANGSLITPVGPGTNIPIDDTEVAERYTDGEEVDPGLIESEEVRRCRELTGIWDSEAQECLLPEFMLEIPEEEEPNVCEYTNVLSIVWILCPMLRGADWIIDYLDRALNNFLAMPTGYFQGEAGDALQQAWSRFRNIGFALLIPIFLIMIISTALGFEFISAYTLKKAMPKMVFAVIFMAISYPLLVEFIFIVNEIGAGVAGIIYFAFGADATITLVELMPRDDAMGWGILMNVFMLAFGLGAAWLFGIIVPLVLFGLVFLLGILAVVILLAAREMLIILLLVLAPIAIIAWIFPASNKLWNVWKDSFFKLVLLYPLIMLLVAGGRSFAQITSAASFDPASESSYTIALILILVAYVGPFFFIPSAMKMGGAAFGVLAGSVLNKLKGAQRTLGGVRKASTRKKAAQRGQEIKTGRIFKEAKEGSLRDKTNRAAAITTAFSQGYGINPRRRLSQAKSKASKSDFDRSIEAVQKDQDVSALVDRRENVEALKRYGEAGGGRAGLAAAKEYLSSEEGGGISGTNLSDRAEAVAAAGRSLGLRNIGKTTSIMQSGTGNGYEDGPEEMVRSINEAFGEDRMGAVRAILLARGLSERKGRLDLAGGGNTTAKELLEADYQAMREGKATPQEAVNKFYNTTSEQLRPDQMARAEGVSINNILDGGLRKQVVDTLSGGSEIEKARQAAKILTTHDLLPYAAPEAAEAWGNFLAERHTINDKEQTMREHLEEMKQSTYYKDLQDEFGSAGFMGVSEEGSAEYNEAQREAIRARELEEREQQQSGQDQANQQPPPSRQGPRQGGDDDGTTEL
jgi:hypothetical protein